MSTASYLDRFLDPVTPSLTPQVAEALINLRLDEQTEEHVSALRDKANRGTLTEEEEADYKAFVDAVDVISVIQSKARRFLANQRS